MEVVSSQLLPDAARRSSDTEYLRELVTQSGMSTRAIARQIGIDDGELRGYLSGRRTWPYPVQFAIEALARAKSLIGEAIPAEAECADCGHVRSAHHGSSCDGPGCHCWEFRREGHP